ncbi:MAG: class I SAM-dependent methyltransferase, partial [Thermoanaerobacteraceae bacterium]|nr:class I SAM-dependent methyltransferase [Thermoanaerobacteraceae bacterium]
MSAEPELILELITPELIVSGGGIALDLGGGRGGLRQPLEKLGYRYLNLDIQRFNERNPDLIGDAHQLPFKDSVFQAVISKDSLEHFAEPWKVVREVHRVLKDGGYFVIWVPFMHPFHGDDFYRYTPLGLQHLL